MVHVHQDGGQSIMKIDQLISYLINKENSEGVVLLGHSTGCQEKNYVRSSLSSRILKQDIAYCILQSPVSDRVYRATLPETTSAMIDLAANMIKEGRAENLSDDIYFTVP
ncbi:BnaAnng08620D [Brassica napus]|uniref:(rape) hypothetical protein n=1 Tax=Brassica napus TaxID=3708 RepID=A0A078IAK8_BRANA|nr:unnamed protein product [Brassica napus]CDY47192.1 BnaAnng08620D [Brassica napus]